MDNYLSILEDSLKQKLAVLDEIAQSTDKQESLLRAEKFSLEDFDACMEEKEQLIERLNHLDDGFESVYARVKEQLSGSQTQYKDAIARMQNLIREITDKSTAIQTKEHRNRNLLERQLASQRRNLNDGKRNSAAIYKSYHNMNGAVDARFMDQKK